MLDLDQHLKQPGESLQECRRGLDDPQVRVARKLALFQRVLKICQAKKNTHLKAELERLIQHYEDVIINTTDIISFTASLHDLTGQIQRRLQKW